MAKVYHQNLRSKSHRRSGNAPVVTFGAADDAAAANVALAISAATVAMQKSLTASVVRGSVNTNHTVGTRKSMKAYVEDSDKSVYRIELRNLKDDSTSEDCAALLTGVAGPEGAANAVVALSAPPTIPWAPHDNVTVANVMVVNKA